MIKFLDLHQQYLDIKPEIDSAIADVIADTAFVGGPHVKRFEQEFSTFLGAEYCIGTGNGTDALEIALEALELPRESEIIVPGNSFIATSEAVTRAGHKVIFCDVDPDTMNIDVTISLLMAMILSVSYLLFGVLVADFLLPAQTS